MVWSIFGRSSEVVYEEREEKPSFRTKLIFLTLSACIISTLILGIAQMVLSVFHFSRQARSDLEFYLENTSGQFDTRIKNMENMVISLRHNNVLKHFIAGEAYNEQEAREQFCKQYRFVFGNEYG